MTNPYIDNHNPAEQDLINDLINEAINIHGEEFVYIPREVSFSDGLNIFNEDRLSQFKKALRFTAYLDNPSTGLDGNGYMIQKFGITIDYNAVLVISKDEWNRISSTTNLHYPEMPCSGDLVYYPITDQLFEIKYVEDRTNPFAQLGKTYTYRCTVELMQYSSQKIETGDHQIDKFASLKTLDVNPDNSLWGGIDQFKIVSAGSGYSEPPEIVVDSLTGSGCCFDVEIDDNGSIKSIEVNDPGFGYHSKDKAYVIGQCIERASVIPLIRTIIENTHDGYGTNTPNYIKAKEMTNIDTLDKPFGPPDYPTTVANLDTLFNLDGHCMDRKEFEYQHFDIPQQDDQEDPNLQIDVGFSHIKHVENNTDEHGKIDQKAMLPKDNFGLNDF